MNLKNKVVIITGASRGLGRKLAFDLAKKKAKLVLFSRNQKDLIEVKRIIVKKYKGKVITVDGDISDFHDVKRLFLKCMKEDEKIDILICNAGVNYKKPFYELEEAEWNSIFNTNVKGVFLCTKENNKHMKKGKIVIISSVAGWFGAKNYAAYCASKHAIEGYAKGMKKDLKNKIKINIFHPYRLNTDFHKNYSIKSPMAHKIKPKLYSEYIISVLEGKYISASMIFIRNWAIRLSQILFSKKT